MPDNIATLEGFTREVVANSDAHTLYLLVKPDTDFDGTFASTAGCSRSKPRSPSQPNADL